MGSEAIFYFNKYEVLIDAYMQRERDIEAEKQRNKDKYTDTEE